MLRMARDALAAGNDGMQEVALGQIKEGSDRFSNAY